MKHEIRKPFQEHDRSQQHPGGESLTHQSMAEQTDINYIMAKYEKSGVIQHLNRYQGQYGDFGDVPGYHEALQRVMDADDMFMSLPASIRDRFGNDPAKFIDFATDKSNLEEMRKMGLAPQPSAPSERSSLGEGDDGKAPKEPKKPEPKADQ